MPQHTLFERSGLTIVVKGELTREEIEILEHEVKTTILDILKFRKFGGGVKIEFLLSHKVPDDWKSVIQHLNQYPNISLHSSRISTQLDISKGRAARILRAMYEEGLLERRCRRNGNSFSCSYRIKEHVNLNFCLGEHNNLICDVKEESTL